MVRPENRSNAIYPLFSREKESELLTPDRSGHAETLVGGFSRNFSKIKLKQRHFPCEHFNIFWG